MYKIEGYADGTWDEANVISSGAEEVNRFATEEDAFAALVELVVVFRSQYETEQECRDSLRVVTA